MGRERKTYLLGGRRVTVTDLIEAELLSPGETLTFHRPRVGRTHTATVEPRGSLLVEGRSYATPSAAACTAAGVTQMDGWNAWETAQGRSLHDLRSELLDLVAEAARAEDGDLHESSGAETIATVEPVDDSDPDDSASALASRHEFLKEARRAADAGKPLNTSVRLLVAQWGGRARGHRISRRIEADLDNHGLVTKPDFMRVSMDDSVSLLADRRIDSAPEPSGRSDTGTVVHAPEQASAETAAADGETENRPEIGLTLGNLVSPNRPLVSIAPNATYAEAMTLMLMHDYSQLPVLRSKHTCIGAVTWKSIAYAQLRDATAPLSDAIVQVSVRSYDHDLHRLLPLLIDEDFLVVNNDKNEITGIVTAADVVGLYGDRTLPFLLIGELDQELRKLMNSIDLDTVMSVCASAGQKPKSYDDMTMYHYVTVLRDVDCWDALGWPLDRKSFVAQLDNLRRVRNDVMHFNPDGVPDGTVDKLRHMLVLIREFGPPDPLV